MSSQECVDFVAERLKDPMKRSKPSLICDEASRLGVCVCVCGQEKCSLGTVALLFVASVFITRCLILVIIVC